MSAIISGFEFPMFPCIIAALTKGASSTGVPNMIFNASSSFRVSNVPNPAPSYECDDNDTAELTESPASPLSNVLATSTPDATGQERRGGVQSPARRSGELVQTLRRLELHATENGHDSMPSTSPFAISSISASRKKAERR